MASVANPDESGLRLRIHRKKSAVAPVAGGKFLGHRLFGQGRLGIAPQSLDRVKARVWEITGRNRGIAFERVVHELNEYLTGWVTYFRYAECRAHLMELDPWIRRKLRCVRLRQRKRPKAIGDFLRSRGVPRWRARLLALSGKGWWRMASSP